MSVRFAPSPTGLFHLGNLRTAWVAGRWAQRLGWPLAFRFEDIDRPRVRPGALEAQLSDMELLGVRTSLPLVRQSERIGRHYEIFERAARSGQVYPCFCSRSDVQRSLARSASAPHEAVPIYSGHCRGLRPLDFQPGHRDELAWRFRSQDESGAQDFIVARTRRPRREEEPWEELKKSFVPAYNWACAIDDLDGGHRLLVRAWDLESVLEAQRSIQRWMDPDRLLPAVFHASLVVTPEGQRLEKRSQGLTLSELLSSGHTAESLVRALESSFREKVFSVPEPGALLGEAKRTISINEILG